MIMSPTELKMQPTIHLQGKPGYGRGKFHVNFANILWVAFSIPSGSLLSLVKYPVHIFEFLLKKCFIYFTATVL
jgi:hypothetical protein